MNQSLFRLTTAVAILLAGLVLLQSSTVLAQPADAPAVEAAEDSAATASGTSEADATESDAEAAAEAQPSTSDEPALTAGGEAQAEQGAGEAAENNTENNAEPDTSAAGEEAVEGVASIDWGLVAMVLAVLIIPVVIGNWIANQISMPDHGWKISTVLMALAGAGLAVTLGEFKGGPDLSGGITLIYEVADTAQIAKTDEPDAEIEDAEADGGPSRRVDIARLIDALKQRVDPAGTKEVTIRQYGDAIEIIIPKASQEDLEYIKRRITDLGQLEFRITASERWNADRPIIEAAKLLGPNEKLLTMGDTVRAEWVVYSEEEFPSDDNRLIRRTAGSREEALVLIDAMNVTGEYLSNATKGVDQRGAPAVNFVFNSQGAARFGKLTGDNRPNASTGASRNLGILLDKRLISAPNINEKITNNGQISGGSMTEKEVDFIISILNAGSLPAALNKTPISEETISPTLGVETVQKGRFAITISLIGVLVFMLVYYRFAGIVACLALAATLLLTLGVMVMMQAAFTLPGLAGLVLTVGMAVDANVLIFERIREELSRGSALRMAIRNGFDRATVTIVDANVTTLITGIVLYVIGTDQIKGFAVTLILGILMSMFTAIFASRLVFEIAERRRWIKSLNFFALLGKTNIDFIGKRYAASVFSLIIIGVGIAAVVGRSSSNNLLNIDFTGGTSVAMVLNEEDKMPIGDVRSALLSTELAEKNLLVVERGTTNSRYSVSTSVDSVEETEAILAEAFGDKLQRYKVDIGEYTSVNEGGFEGTEVALNFNDGPGYGEEDGLSHDSLLDRIRSILKEQGQAGLLPQLQNDDYQAGSSQRFKEWNLRLPMEQAAAEEVVAALESSLTSQPIFPLANKIGGKVAGNLQVQAIYAILVSLLGIVGYIWFRFQNVSFGLAAVVALLHDVLVTLGAIAISAYVVNSIPALGTALQLDAFQISLPIVAAFLTIIGYSLNDTIVVFDRIREVRGKSPTLSAEMINTSINQTLSRTLLTSLTTFIVVVLLYFFGGAGIHGFAFALVIGVLIGTYSSIFVASPALLALVSRGDAAAKS